MGPLLEIISKPDNIPIVAMIPLCVVLLALWWRTARRHDRLLEEGGEQRVLEYMVEGEVNGAAESRQSLTETFYTVVDKPAKVQTWPNLVRVELLMALAVLLLVTVWSILVDAPLEQLADAARTPNPSKAPWYFLGLQEMLVYFDPWIAGVALPLLIIVGLSAIPYLDVNPRGNGYYCWRERRFAIATFLFGSLVLWLLLMLIGVFCRGPGWGWYWPWEAWDHLRVVQSQAIDWPELLGVTSNAGAAVVGGLSVLIYYATALIYWYWRRHNSITLQRMGRLRYAVTAFLFLTMMALPIKMLLRLGLSVKYVWVTPWFSI